MRVPLRRQEGKKDTTRVSARFLVRLPGMSGRPLPEAELEREDARLTGSYCAQGLVWEACYPIYRAAASAGVALALPNPQEAVRAQRPATPNRAHHSS